MGDHFKCTRKAKSENYSFAKYNLFGVRCHVLQKKLHSKREVKSPEDCFASGLKLKSFDFLFLYLLFCFNDFKIICVFSVRPESTV